MILISALAEQSAKTPGCVLLIFLFKRFTIKGYIQLRKITTAKTKPNPSKDGDGKPRVLASFEKPRNDPSKDPKIARLPHEQRQMFMGQHDSPAHCLRRLQQYFLNRHCQPGVPHLPVFCSRQNHCSVMRTGQGVLFRPSNVLERASLITLNDQTIQRQRFKSQ